MSDTEQPAAKSAFTEKEERVLKVALLCLKSGPPEIDIDKLVKLGGFNTAKTAANTWGVIKKKLASMQEGDGDGAAAASPAKAKATPKKRGKPVAETNDDDDDDEETKSPKKKAKATPRKKKAAAVKAESDGEAADEENA